MDNNKGKKKQKAEPVSPAPAPVASDETALATRPEAAIESELPAYLRDGQAGSAASENLDEGCDPRSVFPEVKIGHGAEVFKMPEDEHGRIEKRSEVVGVILDSHPYKTYWDPRDDDGGDEGRPPDCFSPDGVRPAPGGKFCGPCAECPMNRFGSAVDKDGNQGKGKACSDKRLIHFLMVDDDSHLSAIPSRLSISATSFKAWNNYMGLLTRKNWPRLSVYTEFGLRAEERGANQFSVLTLKQAGFANVETFRQLQQIQKRWREAMRTVTEADLASEAAPAGEPAGAAPAGTGQVDPENPPF